MERVARYLLLNGPNLNLLGTREPDIYGEATLSDLVEMATRWASDAGVELDHFQSNHEGALIDRIHAARGVEDAIVFNPGAYTHTSFALHDALAGAGLPTVEVHISNIEEREEWRRTSVIRPACVHSIYGRGLEGYRWAINHLVNRQRWMPHTMQYDAGPDHVMDLRIPEGTHPPPLIGLVHGGFWRHMWTRDLMDGIAVDLAGRGIATANIEYRRVGKGGGWPGSADDVTTAVHALLELEGIDSSRVAVVGHSAGAHLAAVAVDRLAEAGHNVMLVSLGGVLDLETALEDNLGDGAAHSFLGGADAQAASPLWMFDSEFDAVVVHGTHDDRVPVEQSRRFCTKHHHATLLELPDADHFGFLDPSSTTWQVVADTIEGRLR